MAELKFEEVFFTQAQLLNQLSTQCPTGYQTAGLCFVKSDASMSARNVRAGNVCTTLCVAQVAWDEARNLVEIIGFNGRPITPLPNIANLPNRVLPVPNWSGFFHTNFVEGDISNTTQRATFRKSLMNIPDFHFVFFRSTDIEYLASSLFQLRGCTQMKLYRTGVDTEILGVNQRYQTLKLSPHKDPTIRAISSDSNSGFNHENAVAFTIGFACPPGWMPTEGDQVLAISKDQKKLFTMSTLHAKLKELGIIQK
jgi:hypothetical protein